MTQDTLYPSGVSWVSIEEESGIEGLIAYVSSKEYPEVNRCYQLICQVHQGGCGAEMHGDSVEEVLTKWNRRSSMRYERYLLQNCCRRSVYEL